jgi:hypothetical protein
MGSDDTEVNGHLDDHDPFNAKGIVSPASLEDAAALCYPWSSDFDGEGCDNCGNMFEKHFQKYCTQERRMVVKSIDRPLLYGHDSISCPFLDLCGWCMYCNKHGADLEDPTGHLHNIFAAFNAGKQPYCSCCQECHYSSFMKDKEGSAQLLALSDLFDIPSYSKDVYKDVYSKSIEYFMTFH